MLVARYSEVWQTHVDSALLNGRAVKTGYWIIPKQFECHDWLVCLAVPVSSEWILLQSGWFSETILCRTFTAAAKIEQNHAVDQPVKNEARWSRTAGLGKKEPVRAEAASKHTSMAKEKKDFSKTKQKEKQKKTL